MKQLLHVGMYIGTFVSISIVNAHKKRKDFNINTALTLPATACHIWKLKDLIGVFH